MASGSKTQLPKRTNEGILLLISDVLHPASHLKYALPNSSVAISSLRRVLDTLYLLIPFTHGRCIAACWYEAEVIGVSVKDQMRVLSLYHIRSVTTVAPNWPHVTCKQMATAVPQ